MADQPGKRLAERLAGGGNEESQARRADGDFWPTPPDVIEALIRRYTWLRADPDGPRKLIWEPHCGEGHIAKRLTAEGHDVVATDLKDRGYGVSGYDFLVQHPIHRRPTGNARFDGDEPLDAIIMNPPFNEAAAHVRQALRLFYYKRTNHLACLLPMEFWARRKHLALFQLRRPNFVHPLGWKPDFSGAGNGIFCVQWCVWLRDQYDQPSVFQPLPRPDMSGQASLCPDQLEEV